MDAQYLLGLVFRWLHILAAITAVGGAVFARAVVFPALRPLPAADRSALDAAMRARWSKIVAAAIAFLLASGLYNFLLLAIQYRLPRWYHPVFGVKFLLALVIFVIASLLAGKTPAAEALRRNAKAWLNLNIVLAVLVVCLSGVLRTAERIPKAQPAAEPAAKGSGAEGKKAFCTPTGRRLVWNLDVEKRSQSRRARPTAELMPLGDRGQTS